MITGLFETHINVRHLDQAIGFYRDVLGLELGTIDQTRRVAFLWMGGRGESMLGLWEKPAGEVVPQHFAFRAKLEDIREHAVGWLKERTLEPYNFLRDRRGQPMVFAWMPALAIYFNDPDGHQLELIAMLSGEPKPELGVVSWEEWESRG